MEPHVVAVCRSAEHGVGKAAVREVRLLAGLGVEGDAHCGPTVQHRSRVRRDPTQPNLRQVHLVAVELFDELAAAGFVVEPGVMGENISTAGLDLLGFPRGTRLRLGEEAEVELTGLRNPCRQLDGAQAGLMAAVLGRDERGELVRRAGVMGVVTVGGVVRASDPISVALPPDPPQALEPV